MKINSALRLAFVLTLSNLSFKSPCMQQKCSLISYFLPCLYVTPSPSLSTTTSQLTSKRQPLVLSLEGELIQLSFYFQNTFVGYTRYTPPINTDYESKNDCIYLNTIYVFEDYRKKGFGKEMFTTTMKDMRKNYKKVNHCRWYLVPIGEFESVEALELAQQKLRKFYKHCGATIDEKDNAFISLNNVS